MHLKAAAVARLSLLCLLLAGAFTVVLLVLTTGAAHADSDDAAGKRSSTAQSRTSSSGEEASSRGRATAWADENRLVEHAARAELQRADQNARVVRREVDGAVASGGTLAENAHRLAASSRDEVDRTAARVKEGAVSTVRKVETAAGRAPVVGGVVRDLELGDRVDRTLRLVRDTVGTRPLPGLEALPGPVGHVVELGARPDTTETLRVGSRHRPTAWGDRSTADVAGTGTDAEQPAALDSTAGVARTGEDGHIGLSTPAMPPVPSTGNGSASGTVGGSVVVATAGANLDLLLTHPSVYAHRADLPQGPAFPPGFAPD